MTGRDAILANVPENGVSTEQFWENVEVRPHFRDIEAVQRACERLAKEGELFWDDNARLWFPT